MQPVVTYSTAEPGGVDAWNGLPAELLNFESVNGLKCNLDMLISPNFVLEMSRTGLFIVVSKKLNKATYPI